MTTENQLNPWRFGQVIAERLSAAILSLQLFEDIDPQAPLGGPDGKKDILCKKNGLKYVAAAYFPTTTSDFSQIEKKFLSDLEGVERNQCNGFVFFTNQHLTVGDRELLQSHTKLTCRDCQIFHLERIRATLDQPSGYGIRLQLLQIPMSNEEQFAYFSSSRDGIEKQLVHNSHVLNIINNKLDKIADANSFITQTIAKVADGIGFEISPPPSRADLFLGESYRSLISESCFSSLITIEILLGLHRAICFDMPSKDVGAFRNVSVKLAYANSTFALDPSQEIDFTNIFTDIGNLLHSWNAEFLSVFSGKSEIKIIAISRFHSNFLRIHPFIDGNGRVARFLLMQQCLDLFGIAEMSLFDKGAEYYTSLRESDEGNFERLVSLVRPVVGL